MATADVLDPVVVELDGGRSYPVHFRSLKGIAEALDDAGLHAGRCLLITDENVAAHYRSPVRTALEAAGWAPHVIVVPAGEATKSFHHLQAVYDEALAWGLDRTTPVLALGGGVVGDLAGLAAATLLRGLPFVQLPTSLIAQVDSAVGGKTGINHATGKNLIGAFYQPRCVCADFATLQTLPQREWTSGMAEVIKHALIARPALFDYIEAHVTDIMLRRTDAHEPMIREAVEVKAAVVHEDERETGRRAILNFGHTFAHAIERIAGYGTFTHGEAVALGMRGGLYLSQRRHRDLPLDRADALVRSIPIAGDLGALRFEDVLEAMQADKKTQAGTLRFVLLDRIGSAYMADDVGTAELRHTWDFMCTA